MSRPLPVRTGHFALESGLHTDRWVELDALFVDPASIARRIDDLAALLAPYRPTAVCGPMTGGALLAQAVAMKAGLRFLHTLRSANDERETLYAARYELPPAQHAYARGQRVALVDDMISAGSSTLASLDGLSRVGATVVVVGALHVSGGVGADHFARRGLPLVALERHPLQLWDPVDCPLCRRDEPLTTPTG